MKYLKGYKIFESLDSPITIEDFLNRIRIPNHLIPNIVSWWNENREHVDIYLFQFNTYEPIDYAIFGKNKIAINERVYTIPMLPHIKLFLLLHESKHIDQHNEGRLMDGYFQTVVDGKKEEFLRNYAQLEKEANLFAIQSMIELGFEQEMRREANLLRGNEKAGEMVYRMMSKDIRTYNPNDFFDLIKSQIL
jgi:hypothetical protein